MIEIKTILLVDDEESILCTLSTILQRHFGAIVETTCSGIEAMNILKIPKSYDVIVSDHNMPGATGVDLLYFVRNNKIKTNFILFSADHGLANLIINESVTHIQKPHIDLLIHAIESLP